MGFCQLQHGHVTTLGNLIESAYPHPQTHSQLFNVENWRAWYAKSHCTIIIS